MKATFLAKENDYVEHISKHLMELRTRLKIIIFCLAVTFLLLYSFSTIIINNLWKTFFLDKISMFIYDPIEIVFIKIKIISFLTILTNIPIIIYQFLKFIARGLNKNEYKLVIKIIPYSIILFIISLLFSLFVFIPLFTKYIILYSSKTANPQVDLKETFNLFITIILYLSMLFQMPLFFSFILKINLINKEKIKQLRIPIYLFIVSISFFITPDPIWIARLIISFIFIVLFELCLKISK